MKMGTQDVPHLEDAFLQKENREQYTGDGSVDLQGKPLLKSRTGTWRACAFILVGVCCERLAINGVGKNLVHFLTSEWHEGNASAARDVNTWSGTSLLTPLVGAFLADAYWGRYRTIVVLSSISFIGMCTFMLSALVPSLKPTECVGSLCPPATSAQDTILFGGLYLVALGGGGIQPCLTAFGADQFDDTDIQERIKKGSFFNWLIVVTNAGAFLASILIVWIQENIGWVLGFGISALSTGIALTCFLVRVPFYRFQRPGGSPLTRICQVIVASFRNHEVEVPEDSSLLFESSDQESVIAGSRKLLHSEGMKCLDKAAVLSEVDIVRGNYYDPWRLCNVTQVEELKILIRMIPIFATFIVFSIVWSQTTTIFIEQGMLMDRSVGSFTIPAASLSSVKLISVIIGVSLYDTIVIPAARKFTGNERGFSDLQRIGIGFFISILVMVSAALLEIRRLHLAEELGLIDENVAVPLSVLWQIPQFCLVGIAESFAVVGQMEFFYDQAPDAMRSLCTALASVPGSIGMYLSSVVLSIVTAITTAGGKPGWIPDNLNKGQLYNFFWFLAGLSFLNLLVFVSCAMKYKHKRSKSLLVNY